VVNIQLPDSASLERTVEVTEAVEKIALDTPGVAHTVAVPGLSFVLNANSSNYGNMFVILKPFHERQGTSVTGEAIVGRLRARFQREVPEARVLAWTELSYLQEQASKIEQFRDLRQNPFSAFVLGAVLVFFVLAGLYESWSTPLAVILVVPMCLLSALVGTALRGLDVNIFVQIGFVVLVGLACKNAILIVEFARQQRDLGKSRREAIVNAAVTRLRPIVMTSACFVHMVPPCFATGAGAES